MSNINYKKMKLFWEKRSSKEDESVQLGTLGISIDKVRLRQKIEIEKTIEYLNFKKNDIFLELGCGNGRWIFLSIPYVKEIYGIDYSKGMISSILNNSIYKENINKIFLFVSSAQKFLISKYFSKILISGTFTHMNDIHIEKMMKNINKMTRKDSRIIIRNSTGIEKRFEVHNEYSEAIKDYYSAIYREKNEYINIMNKYGFTLDKDEDYFNDSTGLNVFKETRLRIYEFRKK